VTLIWFRLSWSVYSQSWQLYFSDKGPIPHPNTPKRRFYLKMPYNCRTFVGVETIEMNKPLKTERIEARVAPEIRELITDAAELEGCSVSEFLVASAKDRAERTLQRIRLLRLTEESQIRFAELMLNPPPPNEAMNEAKALYDQLIVTK
jgi:uncharacterized protein (DUF1778 family)